MEPALEKLEAKVEEVVSSFDELADLNQTMFMNTERKTTSLSETWILSDGGKRYRRELLALYSDWRQSAEPLIRRFLPEKDIERFQRADQLFREYVNLSQRSGSPLETKDEALNALHLQKRLVEAIPSRVSSERLVTPRRQSERILTEELHESKRLLNDGIDRAAGVLAGVALERHLTIMAESSPEDVDFSYSDSISSLATSLREVGVINEDDERQLDYLSGLRNKCAHADREPPSHDEVNRLVEQVDDFINRYS